MTVALDIKLIDPNPANPRKDLGDLDLLTTSIQDLGIITPVTVIEVDGRYQLVAGHRRLAAAIQAGLDKIPATVRDDLDPSDILAIALAENLARDDINPVDEAEAYVQLVDAGWSQARIARQVGRSSAHVSKRIKLLELPDHMLDRIRAGELPAEEAYRAIAKPRRDLNDDQQRPTILRMIGARAAPMRGMADTIEKLAERWDDAEGRTQLVEVTRLLRQAATQLEAAVNRPSKIDPNRPKGEPIRKLLCSAPGCGRPLVDHRPTERCV